MAAAGTNLVSMEEPALRSVSSHAFGTTALVRWHLLGNRARLDLKEIQPIRTTKQPDPTRLDCIQLKMTQITLRVNRGETVRITKRLDITLLGCLPLLMAAIKHSKYSVIFIQSLGFLGTRRTSSNDPTSFGSEITRLTKELLVNTT